MEQDLLMLKAVADGTRLRIVKFLLRYNSCVRALAKNTGLSEATISQHLKILREAGLVRGEKRGYFTHYSVNREELLELSGFFKELAAIERQQCKSAVGRCEISEHCKGS